MTQGQEIAEAVQTISDGSAVQAQGITQINQGISQVDQVTQQNTANAEETASVSQEMLSQAGSLQQIVQRFNLRTAAGTISTSRMATTGTTTGTMENCAPSV